MAIPYEYQPLHESLPHDEKATYSITARNAQRSKYVTGKKSVIFI